MTASSRLLLVISDANLNDFLDLVIENNESTTKEELEDDARKQNDVCVLPDAHQIE